MEKTAEVLTAKIRFLFFIFLKLMSGMIHVADHVG